MLPAVSTGEDLRPGAVVLSAVLCPASLTPPRARASTLAQFVEGGCDNCHVLGMDGDSERVMDCTTPNFEGYPPPQSPCFSVGSSFVPLTLSAAETDLHPQTDHDA